MRKFKRFFKDHAGLILRCLLGGVALAIIGYIIFTFMRAF